MMGLAFKFMAEYFFEAAKIESNVVQLYDEYNTTTQWFPIFMMDWHTVSHSLHSMFQQPTKCCSVGLGLQYNVTNRRVYIFRRCIQIIKI